MDQLKVIIWVPLTIITKPLFAEQAILELAKWDFQFLAHALVILMSQNVVGLNLPSVVYQIYLFQRQLNFADFFLS